MNIVTGQTPCGWWAALEDDGSDVGLEVGGGLTEEEAIADLKSRLENGALAKAKEDAA